MKKILLTATLFLTAVSLVAQTVARMSDLTPQQKEGATDLILTGQLSTVGNSDFRQLRDLCHRLKRVDLSHSDVLEIPKNAFHSRHRLQQVILPQCGHSGFLCLRLVAEHRSAGKYRHGSRCRFLRVQGP